MSCFLFMPDGDFSLPSSSPFKCMHQASLMFTKQDVAIRHLFHFRETGGGDLSDEAFSPYALATFFLFYILMVRRSS